MVLDLPLKMKFQDLHEHYFCKSKYALTKLYIYHLFFCSYIATPNKREKKREKKLCLEYVSMQKWHSGIKIVWLSASESRVWVLNSSVIGVCSQSVYVRRMIPICSNIRMSWRLRYILWCVKFCACSDMIYCFLCESRKSAWRKQSCFVRPRTSPPAVLLLIIGILTWETRAGKRHGVHMLDTSRNEAIILCAYDHRCALRIPGRVHCTLKPFLTVVF